MGPTLAVLVEYALIGLARSPALEEDDGDDEDWRQECADLLDVHLGFDEARKKVVDSLPEGKLKAELQAQESQTTDQLCSLLAKGPDAKAFEEFDQLMKSCPL